MIDFNMELLKLSFLFVRVRLLDKEKKIGLTHCSMCILFRCMLADKYDYILRFMKVTYASLFRRLCYIFFIVKHHNVI